MNTINKIGKNTGIIVAGNVIFKLISLVVTIYLARYLGVADYGKFNFLFAYISFFTMITDLGLQATLIREMAQERTKTPELIGNAIIITLLLSILASSLSIAIISLMSYPPDTTLYVYIISVSIFFISYSDVYTSIFRTNLKMQYNLYAKITNRIVSAVLIFAIIFYGGTLLQIVIVMVVSEFIKLLLNHIYGRDAIKAQAVICLRNWAALH